jgi:hypothetical protein
MSGKAPGSVYLIVFGVIMRSMALAKSEITVAEGMLLLLFSGLQLQKSQISHRALAPVETTLVDTIRIKKRYPAAGSPIRRVPQLACPTVPGYSQKNGPKVIRANHREPPPDRLTS